LKRKYRSPAPSGRPARVSDLWDKNEKGIGWPIVLLYDILYASAWEELMAERSVLTVRLPDNDIKRLDRLASQRHQTRSQLVQQTLQALLENDEEQRQRQIDGLRERLRPAVEAQNDFLDHVSIADEHRSF
jgi:predicted transcriptional regulator